MPRRTYNEARTYSARVMRWREQIYKKREVLEMVDVTKGVTTSFKMTAACQLFLLRLSDDMDAKGYVSIPRSDLATALDVAPARITEWMHTAHRFGLLTTTRRGRPGVTAVYQAVTPGPVEVRHGVPSQRYATTDQAEVRHHVPLDPAQRYATTGSQEYVQAGASS